MKKLMMALAMGAMSLGNISWAALPGITVHQDPNCGCCSGWAQHMRDNGFKVKEILTSNMYAVKQQHGVPTELASCHTAKVEGSGQVIEGHVPANAVQIAGHGSHGWQSHYSGFSRARFFPRLIPPCEIQ